MILCCRCKMKSYDICSLSRNTFTKLVTHIYYNIAYNLHSTYGQHKTVTLSFKLKLHMNIMRTYKRTRPGVKNGPLQYFTLVKSWMRTAIRSKLKNPRLQIWTFAIMTNYDWSWLHLNFYSNIYLKEWWIARQWINYCLCCNNWFYWKIATASKMALRCMYSECIIKLKLYLLVIHQDAKICKTPMIMVEIH